MGDTYGQNTYATAFGIALSQKRACAKLMNHDYLADIESQLENVNTFAGA